MTDMDVTDDVIEFLKAREAEREAAANADLVPGVSLHIRRKQAEWTLADVESKRQIIALVEDEFDGPSYLALTVLAALALPFADHPDYQEEWKP
jgi:hypothetical protein